MHRAAQRRSVRPIGTRRSDSARMAAGRPCRGRGAVGWHRVPGRTWPRRPGDVERGTGHRGRPRRRHGPDVPLERRGPRPARQRAALRAPRDGRSLIREDARVGIRAGGLVLDLRRARCGRRTCVARSSQRSPLIELKSEIVDVNELLGTLDRKRQLARQIAQERGWHALTVSAWLAVADTRMNGRRVDAHGVLLRSVFVRDQTRLRAYLRDPVGPVAVLTFLSYCSESRLRQRTKSRKRFRVVSSPAADRGARTDEAGCGARSPPTGVYAARQADQAAPDLSLAARRPGRGDAGAAVRGDESAWRSARVRGDQPSPARASTWSATMRRWIWFVPS